MLRFVIILVVAYVLYYLIKSSLKEYAFSKKNAAQKFRNSKENTPHKGKIKEIAYVLYSSIKDNEVCDVCKSYDGNYFLPDHKMLQSISPPHVHCKNAEGCRCSLVYVTRDEEQAIEIESILRRFGGMRNSETVNSRI